MTHENSSRPDAVRRLRHLRQARARVLLLDDWGYASLVGDGTIPEEDHDAVMRALMDCPVHAIIEMGEHRPSRDGPHTRTLEESPEPDPKTEDNEAISDFVR